MKNEETDAQGASWGWWGWLEEHLVDRVTDLKKEWKGKVRVHVARTDSFRSSLLLPIDVLLGNIFSFSKEGMVVEQLKREVVS